MQRLAGSERNGKLLKTNKKQLKRQLRGEKMKYESELV